MAASQINAEVLASQRDVLVAGRLWRMRPLRPSEMDRVASYPEGSGATDWIVEGGGGLMHPPALGQ